MPIPTKHCNRKHYIYDIKSMLGADSVRKLPKIVYSYISIEPNNLNLKYVLFINTVSYIVLSLLLHKSC